METTSDVTATSYSEPAEAKKEKSTSKKALIGFISGASIVFASAIYYCISSGHTFEAGVLGAAIVLVGIFAASLYRSFK